MRINTHWWSYEKSYKELEEIHMILLFLSFFVKEIPL